MTGASDDIISSFSCKHLLSAYNMGPIHGRWMIFYIFQNTTDQLTQINYYPFHSVTQMWTPYYYNIHKENSGLIFKEYQLSVSGNIRNQENCIPRLMFAIRWINYTLYSPFLIASYTLNYRPIYIFINSPRGIIFVWALKCQAFVNPSYDVGQHLLWAHYIMWADICCELIILRQAILIILK